MKFHSIKLKCFRQYKDEELITFSGLSEDEPNVTIVRGPNGHGKTGIFRAFMFCLYGDLYLDQDGLIGKDAQKGLILVNEKLLEESPGKMVEASVELMFSHKGILYRLERTIGATLDPRTEEIFQEIRGVSLQPTELTGNTKFPVKDPNEVKDTINQLMNARIRDFFLFDGERMEKITKTGVEQRQEIQKGIRAILQLDTIDEALKGLDKQDRHLTKKIKDHSSGDLEAIVEEKEQIESKILQFETDINNQEKELEKNYSLIQEIENKLADNHEIRELTDKRKRLKESLQQNSSAKENNKEILRSLLSKGGQYLASTAIAKVTEHLETKRDQGSLNSKVSSDIIEKLLKTSRCLCGTHLPEGSDFRKAILELNSVESPLYEQAAQAFLKKISPLSYQSSSLEQELSNASLNHSSIQDNCETMNKELARLDDELKDIPDTAELADELQQLKKIERSIIEKIATNKKMRSDFKEKLEAVEKKLSDASSRDSKSKKYNEQRKVIKKASVALTEIKEKYEAQIRNRLAQLATVYFKKLIDDDAKRSLASIDINDKFQLDVLNHSGRGMLSQISSGQRQIVSLSYICALIEISNLELPLLMDTPFGRLSGAPRDACLQVIPNVAAQWIVLATDTEFREDEATALRKSEKWGRIYELKPLEDRYTKVREEDVNRWIPKRQLSNIQS